MCTKVIRIFNRTDIDDQIWVENYLDCTPPLLLDWTTARISASLHPVDWTVVFDLWPGFTSWRLGTGCPMEDHDNMDYFYQQVLQKDVTRRLQVGQNLIDYLNDPDRSPDVEQDKPRLDKTIDELTGWINSSNFKVRGGKSSPVIVWGCRGARRASCWPLRVLFF